MEKLKEYLKENLGTLKDIVRDIISYDDSLEWLNYMENDEEFFEIYFADKVLEAVRAVCYGSYKYTDDYVKLDGYGNLESCSKYEYESELIDNIDEIIERLIELQNDIFLYDNKLKELLENIKEGE